MSKLWGKKGKNQTAFLICLYHTFEFSNEAVDGMESSLGYDYPNASFNFLFGTCPTVEKAWRKWMPGSLLKC